MNMQENSVSEYMKLGKQEKTIKKMNREKVEKINGKRKLMDVIIQMNFNKYEYKRENKCT